ncbi:MAG: putative DNA-binding domain-containing protein [Rhizobiales bacterium]|nr:putative DNA-binding domain-containing protein [Hyphomicrobiales bacterium]
MNEFERLQDEFQRSIVSGDDKILGEILDSPKEKRDVLLGVYRHAYVSRLVEALRNDHEHLHGYLGDEMFDKMGAAYVAARPSQHPNMRWFSQGLPEFLKTKEPYRDYPVVGEIASFEKALNDAFDGVDDVVIKIEDVAAFAPEDWNDLRFKPHATAIRLDLSTNALAIWQALKNEETPLDAVILDEPNRVLVWRDDVTPMFRELPAEEAMMWDEASSGIPFGVLCSMLATFADSDSAASRGAGYLHGWVTSGLLAGVSKG